MLGDEGQRDHSVVVSLLRITYDPAEPESVVVEVDACTGQWCRRGDLNPHALAGTSPSSWRVCLFRHSDELAMGKQRSEIVTRGHRPTSGPERAPTRADAGLTQPARSPHTTLT